MAPPLQHDPPAQQPGLSATSAGDNRPANALTFNPDQSAGAGQIRLSFFEDGPVYCT